MQNIGSKNIFKEKIDQFIDSDSPLATASKILLAIAAGGGLMMVGPALPGIYKIVRFFKQFDKYSDQQFRNALYNLKRKKLIRIIDEKDGKTRIELTMDGKKKIRELSLKKLKISVPEKWDKKWRVLIFDIPTNKTYNRARDALRVKIKQLGFYQLQRSVWIHPFPCEEEILFVAESYKVERFIEILVVDKLLHENVFRKKFNSLIGT